ncbi:MAG: hypothetical protein M1837_002770 [Sclerophora amabilis]|nr:MAG: hypothetical protein M1837_002770 [Sclerophora amabilis]
MAQKGHERASLGSISLERSDGEAIENDETIYFIAIGNIPFKYGWQNLKDLVKGVLENEHDVDFVNIRVGPDQRSRGDGHVTVKGAAAARCVYERLNGFIWEGRQLEVWLPYSSSAGPFDVGLTTARKHEGVNARKSSLPNAGGRTLNISDVTIDPGTVRLLPWDINSQYTIPSLGPTQISSANGPNVMLSPGATSLSFAGRYAHQQATEFKYQSGASLYESVPYIYPMYEPSLVSLGGLNLPMEGSIIQSEHVEQHLSTRRPHGEAKPNKPALVHKSHQQRIKTTANEQQNSGRGIRIANLPPNTQESELKGYLQKAGSLLSCVISDQEPEPSKVYASARFASVEGAAKAVDMSHSSKFKGREIQVHVDRSAHDQSDGVRERLRQPLVVNGSTAKSHVL